MGQLPCSHAPTAQAVDEVHGEPVTLHIYDVTGDSRVQLVNELFRPVGAGAFHAGVEIYGQEWSFGGQDRGGTGVFSCPPKGSPVHRYRESVKMSPTICSEEEVDRVIERLKAEWRGRDYELVSRNCCHFCDALCRALGVGPLPAWVTNLAGTSATLLNGVEAVQGSPCVLAMREAWESIDVELECVRAAGVDMGSLQPGERLLSLRLAPGKPGPVGPKHQPEIFRPLEPALAALPLARAHEQLFELNWQPPCLYLRRPALDIPILVAGRPVRQLTYVLLRNAEVGLCAAEGSSPALAFRVVRPATGTPAKVGRLLLGLLGSAK